MKRRTFVCAAVAGIATMLVRPVAASQVQMDVYKDPNCECCSAWAAAMSNADFNVLIHEDQALASVKEKLRIPAGLHGCHTAVVSEYFFEGHVPLEAVERVLNERPQIAGIAVPGMPSGSLGMGTDPKASYDVYSLSKKGRTAEVFMVVRPS